MPTIKGTDPSIVTFLRQRDYAFVKELGSGACGRTVLLRDDTIGEHFVCKKFHPYAESERAKLFDNFVREVKLMYRLHHNNVVRIFNHHFHSTTQAGFIVMEYIEGDVIDAYVARNPDQLGDLFVQAISGFAYLERSGILHRDIRMANLMVHQDGRLKIIDLGFGKAVANSADFDKSISLNLWCPSPLEFADKIYDFGTEVYFVGRLFEELIQNQNISGFKHADLLKQMSDRDPKKRMKRFAEVDQRLHSDLLNDISFSDGERAIYQEFSATLLFHLTDIERRAKYKLDANEVSNSLYEMWKRTRLGEFVPNSSAVIKCFIEGGYKYRKAGFKTEILTPFVQMFRAMGDEKRKIILSNLHSSFDNLERFILPPPMDDSIPF